jgi:hypothetical protein
MGTNAENGQVVSTVNDWGHLCQTIESQRASAPTLPGTADRADRRGLRTHAPYNWFGSPASEQSAHHAADQAAWTATATTAVMVSTTPAAMTGQMVVIGFVAAAGAGVRR